MIITEDDLARGMYVIRCVKDGGLTLTEYGQYEFGDEEDVNLLNPEVPETLRANDYWVAHVMCTDTGFELAQRISAGELEIVKTIKPSNNSEGEE